MNTDAMQYRIHNGDSEAFTALCRAYGADAYRAAFAKLQDEASARDAVKKALLALRTEIRDACGPVDIRARLAALIGEAAGQRPEATPASEVPYPADETVPPYALEDVLPEPIAEEAADEIRYDGRRYRAKARGYIVEILLALLFAVVFFWLLFAALMRGGAIPFRDWGYTWFNEHVFGYFHIHI